jgi:molecular chaperone DnaK (HSP70)
LLTVQAVDKGTNKKERITITNDMGRLSKEEIDKMVADSEKFAEEDKKNKRQNRFEKRNGELRDSNEIDSN